MAEETRRPRVLYGVTGGIAAYKAPEVVRRLTERGFEVHCVLTAHAAEFVTPLALQTVSGNRVMTTLFNLTDENEIGHVRLAERADLFLVAPATANVIGKLACGIADDLLTTMFLVNRAPALLAPAMNDLMYEHPTVQSNLARLADLGVRFVDPAAGWLACGRTGTGRMAEPADIAEEAARLLAAKDLAGVRVLVTAGPTRERFDPVRYLSNPSTGKMGYAMARAAARRGATVTLVSGPTALPDPAGVETVRVESADEMAEAVTKRFSVCDMLLMCAAVADYKPEAFAPEKEKKAEGDRTLRLVRTPDILSLVVPKKAARQVVVGFAAETGDVERKAREKRERKGMDLIVGNDVTQPGAGFAADTNSAVLIGRDGEAERVEGVSKDALAERILDRARALMAR